MDAQLLLDQKKENICTNKTSSKGPYDLFGSYQKGYTGKCDHPCNYLEVQFQEIAESGYNGPKIGSKKTSEISLVFKPTVKKTEAYYAYEILSFFAEVGGYWGLLLGHSVYNLSDLFEHLSRKVSKCI